MANKVKPIKPSEVLKKKEGIIPDEVLEAFNELIAKKFDGQEATILQKDAVSLIVKKGLKERTIFDENWLDIEDLYQAHGWKVYYDKPAYCESYEPSFTFSKKK